MKFEKVNEDKMKITLSKSDLEENNIDFHSFMSNSDETQSLFLSVLDKAEREYGFSTENYRLKVETIVTDKGTFIFTITRIHENEEKSTKKKLKVSKKISQSNIDCSVLIYKFENFEDFCSFVDHVHNMNLPGFSRFAKITTLYNFNSAYYLVFGNVNTKYPEVKKLYSSITEFAKYVTPVHGLIQKIHESGKVVIKSNAIKTCEKYFLK